MSRNADGSAPSHHAGAKSLRRAGRLGFGAAAPGDRARRSGGDALLEPPPAPRSLLRRPAAGAVLHTLNLRLHPDDLSYIANHAGDRVVIVDAVAAAAVREVPRRGPHPRTSSSIARRGATPAGTLDYEALLADASRRAPMLRSRTSAPPPRCATLGHDRPAEGRGLLAPRDRAALAGHRHGRQLRHRANATSCCRSVPMFHANAWGLPFTAALVGARAGVAGAAPRSAPACSICCQRARDAHRRRADDLARRAAALDAGPGALGPVAHARAS